MRWAYRFSYFVTGVVLIIWSLYILHINMPDFTVLSRITFSVIVFRLLPEIIILILGLVYLVYCFGFLLENNYTNVSMFIVFFSIVLEFPTYFIFSNAGAGALEGLFIMEFLSLISPLVASILMIIGIFKSSKARNINLNSDLEN